MQKEWTLNKQILTPFKYFLVRDAFVYTVHEQKFLKKQDAALDYRLGIWCI